MLSFFFEAITESRVFFQIFFSHLDCRSRRFFRRKWPINLSSVEEMGRAKSDGEDQKGNPATAPFGLNGFTVIKEGEAEILIILKNEIFYNKSQVNTRDMSIAVLRTFIPKCKQEHEQCCPEEKRHKTRLLRKQKKKLLVWIQEYDGNSNGECEVSQDEPCRICEDPAANGVLKGPAELKPQRVLEALSASGFRSLRYAREVDGIGQVVALDIDNESVEACRRNIKFNGSVACLKVESQHADARLYMLTHPKGFDVVKNNPVKPESSDRPGSVILAKEPVLQANFARAVASLSKAQAKKGGKISPKSCEVLGA